MIALRAPVAALLSIALLGALPEGASAPLFSAPATLGQDVFTFDLAAALKKGPVVLYFYPAAFTEGCTQEAHDFAENIGRFKALGATVIGVSGDDIEKLKRFATSECRGKFPVAADKDLKIAKGYDATLVYEGDLYANRVSYVIGRDGKIVYEYVALDPGKHVENALEALRKLKR